jgi:ATP/maltotriose-dependent transcriptional regulator MalT
VPPTVAPKGTGCAGGGLHSITRMPPKTVPPLTTERPVLRARLAPPPPGRVEVPRDLLLERLLAELQEPRPVVLVAAPAGYGKTTLTRQLAERLGARLVWLALDRSFDDPRVFLLHLSAALVEGDVQSSDVAPSAAASTPQTTDALDPLIADLEYVPGRTLLVLDNLHAVVDPGVLSVIADLVDHVPPAVAVVLTTREDPALPLARWRVSGRLVDVRADDLRFDSATTARYLALAAHVELGSEELDLVEGRVAGWPAALALLAASLRRADRPGFTLDSLARSDRYVVDYVLDEVLAGLPASTRDFVTQTAILEDVCGGLCDAVTGRRDGERTLVDLEREGLFLTATADAGWFRYHPLFAGALGTVLGDGERAVVEQRAAEWYRGQGLLATAVEHALLADDLDLAAGILGASLESAYLAGDATALERSTRLVADRWDALPPLRLAHAWASLLLADLHAATNDLDRLEAAVLPPEVARRAAVVRAWVANRRNTEDAEAIAKAAADGIPGADALFAALSRMCLGEVILRRDPAAAAPLFNEADRLSAALGRPRALFGTVWNVVHAAVLTGQRDRGERAARAALAGQQGPDGRWDAAGGLALVPLGIAEYERDAVAAAVDHLRLGHELCQRAGLRPVVLGNMTWYLVRALHANGEREEAWRVLRDAARVADERGLAVPGKLMPILEGWLLFAEGDAEDAAVAASRSGALVDDRAILLRACLALARGDEREAHGIAMSLLDPARPISVQRRIAGELVAGIALLRMGRNNEGLACAQRGLALAESGDYRRAVIDIGPDILPLLRLAPPSRLLDDVIGAFRPPDERTRGRLVEPLTEREMEVLRLLVVGSSNAEIAEALYIGAGTAKWHVHNVLGKLGIERRSQAAARARELRLVGT